MIKYTSIESVLYNLSLTLDEQYWDETKMLEWAIQGFRKASLHNKFQTNVKIIPILAHKGVLPKDAVYINQILRKTSFSPEETTLVSDLLNTPDTLDFTGTYTIYGASNLSKNAETLLTLKGWRAMLPSGNPFLKSVHCTYNLPEHMNATSDQYYNFTSCEDTYHVDPDMTVTTSFKEGLLFVSYLCYAKDVDGHTLIPDEENLKEALMHYCMYSYWLSKSFLHEQASVRERDWHLRRYQTLISKAVGRIDSPTIPQLEAYRNRLSSILPESNQFEKLFSTLNNKPYTI